MQREEIKTLGMSMRQQELSRVTPGNSGREREICFPPTLGPAQEYEIIAIPLCKAGGLPSALPTSLLAGPASLL